MARTIREQVVAEHRGEQAIQLSRDVYGQMAQILYKASQEAELLKPEVKIFRGVVRQNVTLTWSTENRDRNWFHGNKRLIATYNAFLRRYYLSLGGDIGVHFKGDSVIPLRSKGDIDLDLEYLRGQVLEVVQGQSGPLEKKYDCTLWCLVNGMKIRASN